MMADGSWRIEIPGWRPTTVNELLRLHWSERGRRKSSDVATIRVHALLCGADVMATCRRHVDLEISRPCGRPLDEDNVWKSLKDALVRVGLLVDDSPRWCEQGTPTFPRGPLRTVITLTDLEHLEG